MKRYHANIQHSFACSRKTLLSVLSWVFRYEVFQLPRLITTSDVQKRRSRKALLRRYVYLTRPKAVCTFTRALVMSEANYNDKALHLMVFLTYSLEYELNIVK